MNRAQGSLDHEDAKMGKRKRRSRYRFSAMVPDMCEREKTPSMSRADVCKDKEVAENAPNGTLGTETVQQPDSLRRELPLVGGDSENGAESEAGSPPLSPTSDRWEQIRSGEDGEPIFDSMPLDNEEDLSIGSTIKIDNWRILWALLMTSGAQKLTRYQYHAMRLQTDAVQRLPQAPGDSWKKAKLEPWSTSRSWNTMNSLPHHSTISRKFKPILYRSLTVQGLDLSVPVDARKAGAQGATSNGTARGHAPIRVVLPSEYARADIGTPAVFDLMRAASLSGTQGVSSDVCSISECIDTCPVVVGRGFFYGAPTTFSVDNVARAPFAEVGDVVLVSLIGVIDTPTPSLTRFRASGGNGRDFFITGRVSSVWPVHHYCRKDVAAFRHEFEQGCDMEDIKLAEAFGFVDYRSPSDLVMVEIPSAPAEIDSEDGIYCDEDTFASCRRQQTRDSGHTSERRAAMKELRKQKEIAWGNWTKPVVKPGDIVAVLKQLNGRGGRLLLIHRFWIEEGERNRHICVLPDGADFASLPKKRLESELRRHCSALNDYNSSIISEISSVDVGRMHDGPRGVTKSRPVSSFGKLESGEEYAIYRFLLYWDGFEISRGKRSSGEGIYMLSLNLPTKSRQSANSVRILSLIPPGASCSEAFRQIEKDIVKGTCEGFVDYDAEGVKRRIFLDLVGFLGDTPAVNAELDTLGHTAVACCHLCHYSRGSKSLLGSRYTDVDFHGAKTSSSRSILKHTAIRGSGAQAETCRLLGMMPTSDCGNLPMHSLATAMFNVIPFIPKTSRGVPILSGHLDPYLSCFVAPDHLLTGHFRDCSNLVLKLLPSSLYRSICEEKILGYLHDCALPRQNRIFDSEKKKLLSMSMTELYSLSVVAEYGFRKGCAVAFVAGAQRWKPSRACWQAIDIVGSCSRLIAELWKAPHGWKHSTSATQGSNCDGTPGRIRFLQVETERHIHRVRSICSMPDSDVRAIEDPRTLPATRAELMKQRTTFVTAIRTIDKPNLHRLTELVMTTLPMVGHVSQIGELILEKSHQILKRAIGQSNNKNAQLQAMNSAIFSDWEGRMALGVPAVLRGDRTGALACARLLGGRDFIADIEAHVTQNLREKVIHALGPPGCIASVLQSGGKTVLSPWTYRAFTSSAIWEISGNKEVFSEQRRSPISERNRMVCQLKKSLSVVAGETIECGDNVRGSLENGNSVLSLTIGAVVEVFCYDHTTMSRHYPFVLTRSSVGALPSPTDEGSSFWSVRGFLRSISSSKTSEVWAAVFPCRNVRNNDHEDDYRVSYRKLTALARPMSFLKMDLSVRRVAVLHDCDPILCRFQSQANIVLHNGGWPLPRESEFYVMSADDGYPPRRG